MKSVLTFAAGICAATLVTRAASAPENYETHCASCHGKDGKGETKAGRKAQVKDLTDKAHQASFTDEMAFKGIKEGRKDENGKEKMKAYGDKLTDVEINGLVTYVRTYGK
jgi:mono/diheme cytochrome c family protein